jgi:hypothetical protein
MFAQALAPDSHDERREDVRHFLALPPALMESDHASEHVHIVNVAHRGFLARALSIYRTGDRVLLTIGIDRIEARIVWCARGMIGGRFAEPLNIENLRTA